MSASTVTISRAALERWEQRLFDVQSTGDREAIKAVRGDMQARIADADAAMHSQWKCGNEFLPFHPQASHVPPDYRNGWNDCFEAAKAATCTESQTEPAFVPRRMRCIKAVPELMALGSEWVEIRPNVFRPAAHPEGDVGLDFNAMGRCGYRMENYLAPVDDGCAQRPEVGAA